MSVIKTVIRTQKTPPQCPLPKLKAAVNEVRDRRKKNQSYWLIFKQLCADFALKG